MFTGKYDRIENFPVGCEDREYLTEQFICKFRFIEGYDKWVPESNDLSGSLIDRMCESICDTRVQFHRRDEKANLGLFHLLCQNENENKKFEN